MSKKRVTHQIKEILEYKIKIGKEEVRKGVAGRGRKEGKKDIILQN